MKGGVFRGVVNRVRDFVRRFRWWGKKDYPNPMLRDPYTKKRSHVGTKRNSKKQGKPRYGVPPCIPGTITYHDKLVRHFGRQRADRWGRVIQAGKMKWLPF